MKKRQICKIFLWEAPLLLSLMASSSYGLADGLAKSNDADDLLELSLDELNDITIATRTSRSSSEIPSTVYVYTQEDIRRHGWNSLAELVPDIPGVDVINKGGRGVTLSVRGVADLSFHGSKTVVMIDGHNAAYSALSSPGFSGIMNQYDIFNAKRVEVQVGPGGTLHGANAFGIVINIITMAPEDVGGVQADLIYGSQGEVIPSVRYGQRYGAWGVFQSVTAWKQTDSALGEIAISKNPDGSLVNYNNDTFEAQTSENFDLHGYVDYDDKLRIGYRYSRVDSGRGTSLTSTEKGRLLIDQPMIYIDYTAGLSDRVSYSLVSHYKKSKMDIQENYFVDTVRNRVGVSLNDSDSLVIDNQFTFFQNSQLTWVSGLYLERSRQRPSAVKIVQNTTDPSDREQPQLNPLEDYDNYAGYLQMEWIPEDKFYLVTGLRYVKTDSKYPSELIPRLGISYALSDNWKTKFNYQKGYRPPGVGDGRARGTAIAGNPDLTSEIIDSYELTLVGRPSKQFGVRATYFNSKINDLIARTSYTGSGGFSGIDENIGRIDIEGIELELNYDVSEKLQIESTATYTDSVDAMGDVKTRTVVPYKLNLSFISRPAKQWEIAWDNYFRWNPTTDEGNALYNGEDAQDWILSNITVTNDQAFSIKNLKLSLSIRNLLNEEYGHIDPRSTRNSGPSGPRTPFLTSYHPQETINVLLGMHYQF